MPIEAYTWSGASGRPTASSGFSRKAVIVWPSGAVSMMPNWLACSIGDAQRSHGDRGARLDVLADHLRRVHAVDVVGAEHDHDVGALVADQVEVLVDGVGGALEPVRAAAHLGRHRRHVVAQQRRQPPRRRDVAVQRVALVLREHDDPVIAGVDQVRQREVDQAVVAAEGHRRLGPVQRQRRQALALAAREDDREHVGLVGSVHRPASLSRHCRRTVHHTGPRGRGAITPRPRERDRHAAGGDRGQRDAKPLDDPGVAVQRVAGREPGP